MIKKIILTITIIFAACAGYFFKSQSLVVQRPSLEKLYDVPASIPDYFEIEEEFYAVNFFASWCSSCRSELDDLAKMKKISGINIYGIAVNDSENQLREMLHNKAELFKKITVNFPLHSLSELNLNRIPRILIIYKGDVIYDHTGEVNSRILEKKILPILKEIKNKSKR